MIICNSELPYKHLSSAYLQNYRKIRIQMGLNQPHVPSKKISAAECLLLD